MATDPTKFIAEHKVVQGDTLSGIAFRYYGSGEKAKWMTIYNANKELIGTNPDLIRPGQVLRIPRLQAEGEFIASHTVVPGDTLSGLAVRYYGSGEKAKWMAIYNANKATIGPDPDLIKPGQTLKIPRL